MKRRAPVPRGAPTTGPEAAPAASGPLGPGISSGTLGLERTWSGQSAERLVP